MTILRYASEGLLHKGHLCWGWTVSLSADSSVEFVAYALTLTSGSFSSILISSVLRGTDAFVVGIFLGSAFRNDGPSNQLESINPVAVVPRVAKSAGFLDVST